MQQLQIRNIPVHAAHASFFLMLSVFPLLTLVLGLLGYTGLRVYDLLDVVETVVPGALTPFVQRVITSAFDHTSQLVVSVSALVTVWSAGQGIYALKIGLDAVYGVQEKRMWLVTRAMCVFYTVLFVLVLLLTLVLHVFSNTLIDWLRQRQTLFRRVTDLLDMRMFVLEAVQILLFGAMYMFLPGKRNGFRESLPGALFSCLGWMAASYLFSLYIEYFPRYFSIFGSVYAIAVGMLWLFTCISILFYGGVLNRLLAKKGDPFQTCS